jgi:hypothetical protein
MAQICVLLYCFVKSSKLRHKNKGAQKNRKAEKQQKLKLTPELSNLKAT